MDIQLIKSTVMRQWLDNTYQINNARSIINEDQANANTYDDWLTQRLGGVTRVEGDVNTAIKEMPVQPIVQHFQPMLDYLDRVSEERTGVSRVSSGIDPEILQNTTATAFAAFQAKAQSRIEMIARIFADTGVNKLMTGIYELVSKYQQKPRMLRITGEWAKYDPTAWEDSADATVEVGLGFGSPERKYVMLEGVLNRQVQAIGGKTPLAGWHNVYNTLEKMVECTDLQHVEPYFEDPSNPSPEMQRFMQMMQGQQQQPDPVMMGQLELDRQKLQLEQMKLIAQIEKNRTDAALKGLDIRVDAELEMMKLNEQATEAAIDDEMQALETVGSIAVQSPDTPFGGVPGNGAAGQ